MFRRLKTQDLPTSPTDYPSGTFIETEKGYFYVLNSTKRYRLLSNRVLDSWSPHRVVRTTEAAVRHYRTAAKMRFRNGSLIHNLADGKVYLIEDGRRRHITSPEAFLKIGVDPDALRKYVMAVSLDEINLHPLGDELK